METGQDAGSEGLPPLKSPIRNAVAKDRPPADHSYYDSFNFPPANDAGTSAVPEAKTSARSSVDDFGPQFVNADDAGAWQFNAGSDDQGGDQPTSRSASAGHARPRSPLKRQATSESLQAHTPPSAPETVGGFDAQVWSDKFGPQTFVPQRTQSASSSPTRPSRTTSRKVRVKPTAGTAAVVEEISSEEERYEWRGRSQQARPTAADSPQAMDIDSPPPPANATIPTAEPSGVRNIPLEPSRPEWRPGNVDSMASGEAGPTRPGKIPLDANAGGSEDSHEFHTSFADLKSVPPFVQQPSGLRSFADLKDNLPFQSRASEDLPIKFSAAPPLVFPDPPVAPQPPSASPALESTKQIAEAWAAYLKAFESYLQSWDEFNGKVVDHFATRKGMIDRTRADKGYGFLGASSDGGVREYFNWVQQDNDVRQRWNACCDQHEKRLVEFMACREKMKMT